MAAREPQDLYGNFGSVPTDSTMSPAGTPIQVRADANNFGGQVGAAVSDVGQAGEGVANMLVGHINEAAQTQAEVGFVKASGDLKAKYDQYEGLQAEAMRPQYETQLAQLHSQFRQGLPPIVQKSFDSVTLRQMAYQTSEYSSYAAHQVKSSNISGQKAIAQQTIDSASNLNKVLDDNEVGHALGTITATGNSIAHFTGLESQANGTDQATGNLSYPDTPEGQAAKAQHLQYTDTEKAKYFLTAAKTIADNQGAAAAADWGKKHWDIMPDAAKVDMNKYLAPKMKNETISGNIVNQNSQIDSEWSSHLLSNVPVGPLDTPSTSANPLDVIRKNEGVGYSKDNKGEVVNGINSLAFPAEFGEAKKILDTQGQAAATKYTDNFYQKNILDKYDIKSLPPATQAIVADGLVNHGAGDFGKSLIQAAKDGASPQQLIDMRRNEYQRLATVDPALYGPSLEGWNNRLDSLQSPQGNSQTFANKADFLRSKEEDYVRNASNNYLKQYPDDYYGAQIQERRARTEIQHQISTEDGMLKSDRDTISNAIGGALTKGTPPATYEQLRALPGMAPVLDKAMQQQGAFFGTIDTMIAKASHRDNVTNSPNGYDTILRTLQPHDPEHPNAISSNDHLAKGLGSSNPGESITWKDYQDAKPALELDPNLKSTISKHMEEIKNANGNVDGKGQDRAIAWYNQTMAVWKNNTAKGDKALSPSDFAESIGEKDGPPKPTPPSRLQQFANSLFGAGQSSIVRVISPDGKPGKIPATQLDAALKSGYKKAQ